MQPETARWLNESSFKTHHRIVNLSHLIGLWWQLPPDLRAHLAEMAPLDPNVLYPRETRHEPPASGERSVSKVVQSATPRPQT